MGLLRKPVRKACVLRFSGGAGRGNDPGGRGCVELAVRAGGAELGADSKQCFRYTKTRLSGGRPLKPRQGRCVRKGGAAIAIYSLNLRSIGKTTHAARTAGAHIRYITRPDAHPVMAGARMPVGRNTARAWLDAQEQADRKNARVIDKLTIALPRELDRRQRRRLVIAFAEKLTAGRASWLAAIHQAGKDASNPHVHLVVRDRDPETGKRVIMLSEKGACDRVRILWEETANAALQEAAQAVRIDRRSYAAQGIQKPPQRHRGPLFPGRDQFHRSRDAGLAAELGATEFVQHGQPFRLALAPPMQPEAGQLAPDKTTFPNKINLNREIGKSVGFLNSWFNNSSKKIRRPLKFSLGNVHQLPKIFNAENLFGHLQIDPQTDSLIEGEGILARKSEHYVGFYPAPITRLRNDPAHRLGQLIANDALGIVLGNRSDVFSQQDRGLYGWQAVYITGGNFNQCRHQVTKTIRHTFAALVSRSTQLHGGNFVPDVFGDSWPCVLNHQVENAPILQGKFLHWTNLDQFASFWKTILISSLFNCSAHCKKLYRDVTSGQVSRHDNTVRMPPIRHVNPPNLSRYAPPIRHVNPPICHDLGG